MGAGGLRPCTGFAVSVPLAPPRGKPEPRGLRAAKGRGAFPGGRRSGGGWGAGNAPVPGLACHPRVLSARRVSLGAPFPPGPDPLSACLPSLSLASSPLRDAQRALLHPLSLKAWATGAGDPVLD